MSNKIEREFRTSPLTAEEAARDADVRQKVKAEFPPADRFFTEEQQRRLAELMARWRTARDQGNTLPPAEQAELEQLVAAELEGATRRAAAMLRKCQH